MGERGAAQVQVLRVRVPRVVEDDQALPVPQRLHLLGEAGELLAQAGGVRGFEQYHVLGGKAAQIHEHIAHALRVQLRVAQGPVIRPAGLRLEPAKGEGPESYTRLGAFKNPAATYSPARFPAEYHRLWRA